MSTEFIDKGQATTPSATPARRPLPEEPIYDNPNVAREMATVEGVILNKNPTEIEEDVQSMKLTGTTRGNDERIAELNRQQAIVNERAATVDTINRNVAAGFGPEGAAADIVGDTTPPNLGIYAEANARHQEAQEFATKYPVTAAYATTDKDGREELSPAEVEHNNRRNFDAEGGAHLGAMIHGTLERDLEIAKTRAEIDDLTIGDIAAGIGMSILPFADTIYHVNIYRNIAGVVGISGDIDAMTPGQLRQQVRESLDNLPYDQQVLTFQRMISALQNNPEYPVSDLLTNEALTNIRKTLLTSGGRGYNVEDGVEDFFLAVDTVLLGAGMFRWVKHARAANRAWKSQRAQQKDFVKDRLKAAEEEIKRQNMQPWQINVDPEAAHTAQKGQEAANSQLPKLATPDEPLTETPDGVIPLVNEERARVVSLEEKSQKLVDDTDGRNYTETEVTKTAKGLLHRSVDYWGGKLRPAMTTFRTGFDGSDLSRDQMRFTHTLGMNDRVGFLNKRFAVEEAQELIDQGYKNVHIVAGPEGGSLTKIMDADDIAKGVPDVPQPGNFYVRFDEDYFMRPSDAALFGAGSRIIGPEWLGKAGRYILTPSAQFDPKFWKPAIRAFGTEQALGKTLRAVAEPIWKLPNKVRRNIDTMYRWAGDFAKENGRDPDIYELVESFPKATAQELEGLINAKEYYDILYSLNNRKLFKDWKSLGYKTLRSPTEDMAYHGKVLDEATLLERHFSGGEKSIEVLDPTTNLVVQVSKSELTGILKEGGSLIETPLRLTDRAQNKTTLVLKRADSGNWKVTELAENPLKYEAWYSPRAYEDFWAVKSNAKIKVNGREVKPKNGEVIGYARTKAEAERFLARLAEQEGIDISELEVEDVGRAVGADRTAADIDHWQVEGRLMFDNRGTPVPAAYGKADVFSPTNMLQRSADMVARDLATTDTLNKMKTQWQTSFGKLLGLDVSKLSASEVTARVNAKLSDLGRESPEYKRALEAHQSWDYIRYVEGNLSRPFQNAFRKGMVTLAETLIADPLLKLSVKKGGTSADIAEWAARNAHNTSIVRAMKTLAFYDFMVSRPTRQLGLQSLQQWYLYGLEPSYLLGQRLSDSWGLVQSWKIIGNEAGEFAGGPKLKRRLIERNAKRMGLSVEDYQILVDRIYESGMLAAVDKHSFAGDLTRVRHTSETGTGAAIRGAGSVLHAPLNAAADYGFSLGEQVNVAGSFNQALRLWRKANNNKSISAMTDTDWDEVVDKAWAFAQSMNRMDSAAYSEGLLQLPLQFISFSHKMLLTGVRGLGGKDKYNALSQFGRKDITPSEARKMLLGQLALWGPAGLGLDAGVEAIFNSDDELAQYKDTEVYKLVLRGVMDYGLNTIISIYENEESNLAFAETFSPSGGAGRMVIETMIDLATEATPYNLLALGASGDTVSGYGEAAQRIELIYGLRDNRPFYDVALKMTSELLTGGFSGYSDARTAWAMVNTEKRLGNNGKYEPIEVTLSEALARGFLGVRSREELNAFALRQALTAHKDIEADARNYIKRINEMASLYPNDPEYRDQLIAEEVGFIANSFRNDAEKLYFRQKLKELELREWGQIGTNEPMIMQILDVIQLEGAQLDYNHLMSLLEGQNLPPHHVDMIWKAIQRHKLLPSTPIPNED